MTTDYKDIFASSAEHPFLTPGKLGSAFCAASSMKTLAIAPTVSADAGFKL